MNAVDTMNREGGSGAALSIPTSFRLIIVESPFAGNVGRNISYARAAIRDCLQRGEAPIASHLLYTQPGILDDTVAAERELGIRAGLEWARVAEGVAFYVDLGWSRGMKGAVELHTTLGHAIEIRTIPGWRR